MQFLNACWLSVYTVNILTTTSADKQTHYTVHLLVILYTPLQQFKYRFCLSNEALGDPALFCMFDWEYWFIYNVQPGIKL